MIGTLTTLVLLSATHSTALLLVADPTAKPTCEEVETEIKEREWVMADTTRKKLGDHIRCLDVFAGGMSAPWAAKFGMVKPFDQHSARRHGMGRTYSIVIKKNNFLGPYNEVTQKDQFSNEKTALQAMMKKSPKGWDDHFPIFVGASEEENVGYVAMGYAPGQVCCGDNTLELMEDQSARQIVMSFTNALEAMWKAGWSHGDHHGGNLMAFIPKNKEAAASVKLLDFGIAKSQSAHLESFKDTMVTDAKTAWTYAWRASPRLINDATFHQETQSLSEERSTPKWENVDAQAARTFCIASLKKLRELIK